MEGLFIPVYDGTYTYILWLHVMDKTMTQHGDQIHACIYIYWMQIVFRVVHARKLPV